jgi:D-alanine transaminase
MENPLQRKEWARILGRLTGAESGYDQLAYLQITRGVDPARNHLFPSGVRPTVFAMAWKAKPRNPETTSKGVSAITSRDVRWLRCDIKSTALLGNVLLRQAAQDAGAEETILIRDGSATEGSSTNFLLVKDGLLVTPPESNLLLPGITRGLVLELAREAGIPCAERAVAEAELPSADELWIVSSSREVVPVTRLNGVPVGSGLPGPVWRRIDGLFQDYKNRLRGVS